jgi:hypothetical protein
MMSRGITLPDAQHPINNYQIPVGSAAQVVVYTEHWHHLSLLRTILPRMRSWENYVFVGGHYGNTAAAPHSVLYGGR